ncbi:MAG: hypothetical protein LBE76_06365 [Nitrososphaerota archaeon]|nr:hypothetical protein [Nitrososphaerota archaeon]
MVGKEKVVVYGEPSFGDIEIIVVESFNGVLCERVGRLVRGRKCFSKLKCRLVCSVELFWVLLDFYQ